MSTEARRPESRPGAGLCVLVALTVGWASALVLLAYFVVYQQVENHAILPVVHARLVALSPFTVLIVSRAGAFLGGLVGVLLAIPLASASSASSARSRRAAGWRTSPTWRRSSVRTVSSPVSEDDAERPGQYAAEYGEEDAA